MVAARHAHQRARATEGPYVVHAAAWATGASVEGAASSHSCATHACAATLCRVQMRQLRCTLLGLGLGLPQQSLLWSLQGVGPSCAHVEVGVGPSLQREGGLLGGPSCIGAIGRGLPRGGRRTAAATAIHGHAVQAAGQSCLLCLCPQVCCLQSQLLLHLGLLGLLLGMHMLGLHMLGLAQRACCAVLRVQQRCLLQA